MYLAGVSAAINIGFGLALFRAIGFEGLAAATSIAAWVNVIGLAILLRRAGDLAPSFAMLSRVARMGLASLVMGAALWWGLPMTPDLGTLSLPMDFVWMGALSGAGLIVYLVVASLLRAYRLADIRSAFSKKASL